MTSVTRIQGAPGCGKTTRLFQIVEEERDEYGTGPFDLYYLTFSRSAVDETESKLLDVFQGVDADPSDLEDRARTFHSLAFSQARREDLIDDPDEQLIMQSKTPEVYSAFCDRVGLSYDPAARDPIRNNNVSGSIPPGNRLFTAANYLQMIVRAPEHCRFAPVELPLPVTETAELIRDWHEFKREGHPDGGGERLFEHADYVQEVIDQSLVPDADVLFIDEFQDLSPQEYLLYKTWRDSGRFDRIYIAGDVNQSIYGFRAAKPRYFAGTDADAEETLSASWRCPAEVVSVARGVLGAHPDMDHRDYSSRVDGGRVATPSFADGQALAASVADSAKAHGAGEPGNSVFLLARANYQVNKIASALKEAGVPFKRLGRRDYRSVWNKDMGRVLMALRALRAGRNVPARATKTLLSKATGRREEEMAGPHGVNWRNIDMKEQVFATDDVWSAFPGLNNVSEIVGLLQISDTRIDELKSTLGRTDEIDPHDVKIGTIHSAKGLEAPCVYLFVESTRRVLEEYYSGGPSEEEHRLHYVGVTRASETLHVVRDYFGAEVFPPFEGALPKAGTEVVA